MEKAKEKVERRRGPELGEMVVYQAQSHEEYNSEKLHPAVITKVWGPDTVNIKVFFDNGPVENRSSCNYKSGKAFY